MNKAVKIALAVAVLILVGGGAYLLMNKNDGAQVDNNDQTSQGNTETTAEPVRQEEKEITTVDGAIAALKDAGLTVSEKQGAYYQIVGAENGDKVDVGATNVEMYEFETEQKAQEAVSQLKNDDNTTYATKTFVILIHSTDPAEVSKIQDVL